MAKNINRRTFVAAGTALAGAGALSSVAMADQPGILQKIFGTAGQSTTATVPAETQGTTASMRPNILSQVPKAQTVAANAPQLAPSPDLSDVANLGDFSFKDKQLQLLAQNGFMVMESGYNEFFEVFEQNRYATMPNFVTADSLLHTYHLYFAHLMKTVEKTYLAPKLSDLSQRMYARAAEALPTLAGTEWEDPCYVAMCFFGIPAYLMDPSFVIDDAVVGVSMDEVWLIGQSAGIFDSPVFGSQEDYTQYIVRGYYTETSELEAYFRAMMWYGRRNFTQNEEVLDRTAALITALMDEETTAEWEAIYAITSFFAGGSDDACILDYAPLLVEAYGKMPQVADLPDDEGAWARFHQLTAELDPPKINSAINEDDGEDHLEANLGFRFMGQRTTIDGAIMQQLVYNKLKPTAADVRRMLPDVLDLPAALGSERALELLLEMGNGDYANWDEQMTKVREDIEAAGDDIWTACLASQWLGVLRPLLEVKGAGYPWFMQGEAWVRKDLLTFAGSFTELKHDTVLYAKQVTAEGGGWFEERDDRGYVEPEPALFGQLASLVDATAAGLAAYGMLGDTDQQDLAILGELCDRLATIATKELTDEALTEDEYDLIRSYGEQLEHFWSQVHKADSGKEYVSAFEYPAPLVTDIATDPNGSVLEIATGGVNTIYALVPIDGALRVASGSVYSFYQFPWPISDRLTDVSWRQMMGLQQGEDGSYVMDAPFEQVWWVDDFCMSYEELWA